MNENYTLSDSQSEMNYWKVTYAVLNADGSAGIGESLIIAPKNVKDWHISEMLKKEGRFASTIRDIVLINGRYVSLWKVKNNKI